MMARVVSKRLARSLWALQTCGRSVTNPTGKLTGAIHVYGGDFFTTERSEWDPENLEERPYDIDKNVKYFEDANRLLEGAD
jgi:predicted metal-dependent enzyme (double-stranded beta helix superfamily)